MLFSEWSRHSGVSAKDTLMQFAIFGNAQAASERSGAPLGERYHTFVLASATEQ
jgi:hypothetical protein